MITNDKEIIWMEKYRPQIIEDLVLPDHYINSFKEYIKNPRNILLTSETPGTGKTSISNAIIKEGQFECLFINASLDNGIDTLRGKIRQFASSIAFNDKCKLVVLDECLEENEEVLLVNNKTEYYSPLKDLEFGKKYKCKSYNMEKNIIEYDTCELISEKEEEVFEVELEDGRKVLVTDNHPFIIREKDKITQKKINEGLKIGDEIKSYKTDDSKIKSIKKVGIRKVRNLTVHKNHTIISKNGIITHNCDGLSDSAQAGIRAIFEEFSSNCRFILTCNYLNKIIEPIINRCEIYNLDDIITKNTPEMIKKIFERLEYILKNENVTYNQSDVVNVIKQNLPSLRSMVAFLQRCVVNNELIIKDIELSSDFNTLLSSIKSKSFEKIIECLYNLPNPDSFYTYSFKHLNIFKPQAKPQAIITLAKYQDMSSKVRDKNLNLCACIMELIQFIDI